MNSLMSWQLISVISRFSALFLGLFQSVIITRILSVSEFGIVGIVGAIGALAGIAQHLGLASGTTREISASKNKDDIFKIFASSVAIKYVITLPVSIVLFVFAPFIAESIYHYPEITTPLRLFAVVLVIQGVQSIFNSIIAGLQHFKKLFLYQTLIAVVSLAIYIPFVFMYRVDGYFISLLIFNSIATLTLGFMALYPIREHLKRPSRGEFGNIFANILYLSLGIYFVKVLYTVWYKFGQLALGTFETLEIVGVFSFALLYSSKLMTVSDALTDVNLPVFSKEFSNNFENFKKMFRDNFDKIYILIMFCAVSASYFGKDIILFAVGDKYNSSIPIIPYLLFAFVFYSYINVLKSSVLIPAKMMLEMAGGYISMLVASVVSFFVLSWIFRIPNLEAMSLSMFLGALAGFIFMFVIIKVKLNFSILDLKILLFSIYLLAILPIQFMTDSFFIKLYIYLIYFVILFYLLKRLSIFNIFSILGKFKK